MLDNHIYYNNFKLFVLKISLLKYPACTLVSVSDFRSKIYISVFIFSLVSFPGSNEAYFIFLTDTHNIQCKFKVFDINIKFILNFSKIEKIKNS